MLRPLALGAIALPLVFIGVTMVHAADAPAPAAPAKTPDYALARSKIALPTRSLIYKKVGDRELAMYIFEPAGHQPTDRRPCFVAIHGGGWVAGTPTIMNCVGEAFAQQGWVVANIRYRLHKPVEGTTVFDSVKDAKSAVRYLRSHARELGIDSEKIVAGGRSAGGHLAAATALFPDIEEESDDKSVSCVPNALVLCSPVIDTSAEGYGFALLGEQWQELSPLHHVRPGLPPTIILHGMRDTITPFAGAKAFDEGMRAAGNKIQLIAHERGGHSYMMRTKELFDEAMGQILPFLMKNGIEGTK
ncbi:MAG: alpha/beta hydrolase [Pirellula sp.]|nr:alpha/beta hydrolase [Pirellula sp.]